MVPWKTGDGMHQEEGTRHRYQILMTRQVSSRLKLSTIFGNFKITGDINKSRFFDVSFATWNQLFSKSDKVLVFE